MCKTSSFRGVTCSKRHSKWQAGISLQGRWVIMFQRNSSQHLSGTFHHYGICPR
jgi:hypothetical protein